MYQSFIGCVVSNFTSCHSMHAWFTPGECSEPRDVRAQIASLYYAYAVDILTDLMSMARYLHSCIADLRLQSCFFQSS
jgi:hypothetical protein